MSYKKNQFDACAFNPMVEGKMIDEYTALLHVFTTSNDNIIRYVIMLYDPRSPLISNESDPETRKRQAGGLSSLVIQDKILDAIQESCIEYLQYINSKQWAAICATEYRFWEAINLIMQPIKGSTDKEQLEAAQKKNVLSESIDDAIKKLDSYYKQMSGGDKELEEQMIKKKKRITPEMIANSK